MTRRLARWALALYPLAFRRRYGDELAALLDQTPPTPRTVVDLLRAALAAHLRPLAGRGAIDGADRVRASATGVLACWLLFATAGFAFYNTTEDTPFSTAGNAHPLLGGAHIAIQVLAVLASAAVVLGCLPVALVVLAEGRRQPRLRALALLPLAAVLVFAGATGLLNLIANSQQINHPSTASAVAFIAWGLLGFACGAVCVLAARKAAFAVPVSPGRLAFAYLCALLVTAAMAAMALATALYAIALALDAPRLAASGNGPHQLISTGASVVVQLAFMLLAAALAAVATRRGWRAARALTGAGIG
jgi:hypothetical protein